MPPTEQPPVTLQEIARAAGVSAMTVSRVLRNHAAVRDATRERVQAAALRLGYRPNPLVSALMTQVRRGERRESGLQLALVHCLPRGMELAPNMETFREVARQRADELGYGLSEFYLREVGMSMRRQLEIVRARGIRGVILEHFFNPGQRLQAEFADLALVAIGRSIESPVFHRIESDQFVEMQRALREVAQRGYRRIGFTTVRRVEVIARFQRVAAFLLMQHELPEKRRVPHLTVERIEDLPAALGPWLEAHRPDVVVTQAPLMYDFLRARGLRMPEDIGYLCLGHNPRYTQFAGVDPNWSGRAEAAVNKLVRLINRNETGVPASPTVTYVESRWVEGPSLRPQPPDPVRRPRQSRRAVALAAQAE